VAVYQDYRMTFRLLSPLGTPMQSDTLFGHIAWQVRHEEGEEGILRFLEAFEDDEPPFVLSDAFPAGLMPRPLFPRPPSFAASPDAYATLKRWHRAPFVRVEDFLRLIRGDIETAEPLESPWVTVETPHAPISRHTGTVGTDPGFYHTEALALTRGSSVHVYLRVQPGWKDRLEHLFRALSRVGFGRDKSVGAGAFEITGFERWDGFGTPDGADSFVSLSTMVPAKSDPTEGRWRLRVKHGFLGEHAGSGMPYKRPLIQFEPGAVFKVDSPPPKPIYGRMVRDIAPGLPEAVQCGLTLAVPGRWRTS